METKDLFLSEFNARVETGEFDKEFTVPFMNRKLLCAAVKGKVNKRGEAGKTPMLTDNEIKNVIEEMKEAAGSTFYLFVTYGILEETENGYKLSSKGAKAIRESSRL